MDCVELSMWLFAMVGVWTGEFRWYSPVPFTVVFKQPLFGNDFWSFLAWTRFRPLHGRERAIITLPKILNVYAQILAVSGQVYKDLDHLEACPYTQVRRGRGGQSDLRFPSNVRT